MSKYYVKVNNGQIVEGPQELSGSSTDSPNIFWGQEQMSLNNIFLVDIDCDPLIEKIDFENPIIKSDSVSYLRIQLTLDEQIIAWNKDVLSKRLNEYPPVSDVCVALWEFVIENRPQSSKNIQILREAIKMKYPKK